MHEYNEYTDEDNYREDEGFFGYGHWFDVFMAVVAVIAVVLSIKTYFWGNPTMGQQIGMEFMALMTGMYGIYELGKFLFNRTFHR